MKGFELAVQRLESGPVHVRVRGALDLAHAYRFDDAMRRVERDGDHCIVVDLSELAFLDSTGIARLVALRRRARRSGRRLVLVRGPRAVQRLFSLAALTEHFEIVGDIAAVVGPAPRRGR
jgi:anti-sigma B factor antagonist